MFTGIVKGTGVIRGVETTAEGRRLTIEAEAIAPGLSRGDSISVSGVCLTAETIDPEEQQVTVFLATETIDRTYLGALTAGDRVNLEPALAADGRFEGHIVQGHVDGTARVLEKRAVDADWWFTFELPDTLAPYLVEKGSIAIDGISLTVADRQPDRFSATIIPETMERTVLPEKAPGDPVHLEVDVIAKYVERLLEEGPFSRTTSAAEGPTDG